MEVAQPNFVRSLPLNNHHSLPYHMSTRCMKKTNLMICHYSSSTGSTKNTLGEHPYGIIVYTDTGFMAMNSMATEPKYRPADLTWPAKEGQSDADWASVGLYTFSYAGPVTDVVEITPTSGNLTHGPLTFAHVPVLVGSLQHREYEVVDNGNLLKLSVRSDNGSVSTLTWRRLGCDDQDSAVPSTN